MRKTVRKADAPRRDAAVRDNFFKRLAAATAAAGSYRVDQHAGGQVCAAGSCAGAECERDEGQAGGQVGVGVWQVDRSMEEQIQRLEGLVGDLMKVTDSTDERSPCSRTMSHAEAHEALQVSAALHSINHDVLSIISRLGPIQADSPVAAPRAATSRSAGPSSAASQRAHGEDCSQGDGHTMGSDNSSRQLGEEAGLAGQQKLRQADTEAAIASLLTRAEGLKSGSALHAALTKPEGDGDERFSSGPTSRTSQMVAETGGDLKEDRTRPTDSTKSVKDQDEQDDQDASWKADKRGEGPDGMYDGARRDVAEGQPTGPVSWREHKVGLIMHHVVVCVAMRGV